MANDFTVNGSLTNGSTSTLNANSKNILLKGNWSNSGFFTPGLGKLTMGGTGGQTMSGSTFYDLEINDPANVTLLTSENVSHNLIFTNGKFILGTNNLTTAAISGGSSSSYAVTNSSGVLKINAVGANDILFPVGPSTSNYNPVTINNAGTSDNFSVKVQTSFDNAPYDATKVVNSQWTVSKDGTVTSNNVYLKYQWNSSTDQAASFNNSGSVVIGHYGGPWDEKSATVSNTGSLYTASASGFTNFSPFGVGNAGSFVLACSPPAISNQGQPQVTQTVCQNTTVNNLSVAATGDGLSYLWYSNIANNNTTGTTTGVISASYTPSIATAGTLYYYCVVTGTCGTITSNTAEVIVNPTPTAPTVIVVDNCNSTSTLTASNYTGTLLWSDAGTDNPHTVSSAGIYTVTQTVNGCTSVASINSTAAPKTTPTAPTVVVVDNCNGTSTLTASNYTGTLLWSDVGTDNPHTVSSAGIYTVTQTVNGCTSVASINATAEPKTTPTAPTVVVVDNCNGTSTLTASNYTGTLLWSDAETDNPHTVSSAGNYTVTQTVNGCTSAASSNVTAAPKTTPTAPTVVVVDNCNGTSTLTASNYTGTLLWSDAGTDNPHTVSSAGNYTVTQTVNGCTSAASSNATAAPKTIPTAPAVTVVDNCNSTSTLTASNYTGTLLWSNGGTDNPHTVSSAGTYTVTQTVNGCTSAASSNVTAVPKMAPIAPTASVTQPTCSIATGTITVTSTTSGLTFSIDGTNYYSGGVFSSVTAGTYYLTAKNSDACISSATVNVNAQSASPATPTIGTITQPTCTTLTGSVVLNGLPATGTWTLTRSPGSVTTTGTGTSATISGLAVGTYSFTVTNSGGCTSSVSSNVVFIPSLPGTPTGLTGTASILKGGTYNYTANVTNATTYIWSYSGTGATISTNSNSATITFSCNATNGNLTVKGHNNCGDGPVASVPIVVNAGSTINIYTSKLTTGQGNHPSTSKTAIMPVNEPGSKLGFKVFRSNLIGITAKRKNLDNIWNGNCTGVQGNCSYNPASDVTASVTVTGPVLTTYGGGPAYKYVMTVPAGKRYLVIAEYATNQSNCSNNINANNPCYVYSGKRTMNKNNHPQNCDEDDDGDDDGDDDSQFQGCASKDMFIQIIQDANGKITPSNTDAIPGSLLLISSPNYLEFTDTTALLPIIYESVDGQWGVQTSAVPPEGFYSVPSTELQTEVNTSYINSLQFTIIDTGSVWTNTQIKTQLFHMGKHIKHIVAPNMIDHKKPREYLLQNIPNPFNSSTMIPYILPVSCRVRLSIFDMMGNEIFVFSEKVQQSGRHTEIWQACSSTGCKLSAGVYFAHLQAISIKDGKVVLNSKSMIFLK